MSSDQAVIRVDRLSKCYHLYHSPRDRLKQFVLPGLMRRLGFPTRDYFKEFWALRDVSFQITRGETVGIVGRNGAGKSTLLQILCGTLTPTAGSVEIEGRVAALLELGSGFNPEFSGRENIFINASILGLERAEIERRFDEIVAFADIGDFLDQPVKAYSSGMYVRLAFAVSACVEPDVLIVDEALAVGDTKFQAKCFRRFEQLVANGTTILLVTHSTEQITRHCDRALLIEAGAVMMDGRPKDVANRYLDLLFGVEARPADADDADDARGESAAPNMDSSGLSVLDGSFEARAGYNPYEYRWGSGDAEIIDFMITTNGHDHTNRLESGMETWVVMRVRFKIDVGAPIYGLTVKTPEGVSVYGCNSRDFDGGPLIQPARSGEIKRVIFKLDQRLGAGEFLLSLGVAHEVGAEIVPLDRRYDAVLVQVHRRSRSFGVAEFDLRLEVASEAAPE